MCSYRKKLQHPPLFFFFFTSQFTGVFSDGVFFFFFFFFALLFVSSGLPEYWGWVWNSFDAWPWANFFFYFTGILQTVLMKTVLMQTVQKKLSSHLQLFPPDQKRIPNLFKYANITALQVEGKHSLKQNGNCTLFLMLHSVTNGKQVLLVYTSTVGYGRETLLWWTS